MTKAQLHKLVHRKLLAAYNLRLATTAEEALEECKVAQLDRSKWKDYSDWLRDRRKEEGGVYNFRELLRKAQRHEGMEICDSKAAVGVRALEGDAKGKGTFTTRDTRAGEILLMERETSTCEPSPNCFAIARDIADKQGEDRGWKDESGCMLRDIWADHSSALVTDALFPNARRESPFASEEERLSAIRAPVPPINTDDSFRKYMLNAFGELQGKASLFGASSLINHSCLPNAGAIQLGRVS